MENNPAQVFLGLAGLFLLSLFVGRLMAHIRVPRVTGYLLTGILVGPSFAQFIGIPSLLKIKTIESMHAMSDVALVLILLTIGMRFRGESLRRWKHRIFLFSAGEIVLTFIFVFTLVILLVIFIPKLAMTSMDEQPSSGLYYGLLLGIMAIATAPAATLLVIREYESEGPLTDAITTLVGVNNLVAIISFNILIHFYLAGDTGLVTLLLRIIIPIGIGMLIGFFMSGWAQKLNTVTEFQLLVLGGALTIIALCKIFEYDFLLACFACGIVLVNSSPKAEKIIDAIKQFDYALYVIFFVLAGASLHLDALVHIGFLGTAYIVGRTLGKILGCLIGARLGKFNATAQKFSGLSMLAQAGVAIGLCQSLINMGAPGAKTISSVIFGSVVIFELIGPISIRFSLVQAGEVPLLTLLAKKASVGAFEGVHQIVDYFRSSIGLPKGHRVGSAKDVLVKHIMRTNVDTIRDNTPFHDLLHKIAHSRYDRFPIINAEERFVGVIDYEDIRDVLFDPTLSNLVVALDLVKKVALVTYPNSTLGDVLKFFQQHQNITYLPVVEDFEPDKLVGVVSQNDVLATFRKFKW